MNIRLNTSRSKGSPSPTLHINELSKQLEAEGKKVYKFGFGQSPFPVPDIVVNELKKEAYQKDYLPVNGLHQLRQAIANYNSKNGLNNIPEDIIVGPGTKILLYLLKSVMDGELLLPQPSWVSYAPQARMLEKPISWLETCEKDNWMLHPDSLESYCKNNPNSQKLLILNYPSNPTGATYNADQLKAFAKVAEEFGLIIISDEIYGEMDHNGTHQSLAKYYPQGTVVSSGLSKWCGAGGWRLGTFTFPKNMKNVINAMKIAASETYSSASAPIQYAAISAYKQGVEIQHYLENSRKVLALISNAISNKLLEINLKHPKPEGGFYLMPNFEYYQDILLEKDIETNEQLCTKIMEETGVALLPGSAFGFPNEKLVTRLSYVDFDGQKALGLIESHKKNKEWENHFLKTISGHMIEGIDRLKNWLVEKS